MKLFDIANNNARRKMVDVAPICVAFKRNAFNLLSISTFEKETTWFAELKSSVLKSYDIKPHELVS